MTDVRDCKKPWDELYAYVNGEVKPCCYASKTIGIIDSEDSISRIWNGDLLNEIRAYIRENRIHPVCAGAPCIYVRGRMPEGDDRADIYGDESADFEGLDLDPDFKRLALAGDVSPMFHAGLKLYQARSFDKALKWLERAAHGRSEYANHLLGQILAFGLAGKRDVPRGYAYLAAAAEVGFIKSFVLLGSLLEAGNGIPRDPLKAAEFYRQGGERGDGDAYYRLALLYRRGDGVERNEEEAQRFMKLAARRGSDAAQKEIERPEAIPETLPQAAKGGGSVLGRVVRPLFRMGARR